MTQTPSDERFRGASRWRPFLVRLSTARARFANRLAGGMRRLAYRATLVRTRFGTRIGRGRSRAADRTIARDRRLADGWARWWRTIITSMALLAVVAASGFLLVRGLNDIAGTQGERAAPSASADAADGSVVDEAVPSIPPSPANDDQLPEVYVNEESGYLFSYPAAWKIVQIEGTDRLVDPSGDVQIMFDVAPSGELKTASERVVEQTTRSYSDVELIESSVETTPQGDPSVVVGVNAIGPGGENVRLLVITVQGPDGNRAITVRFSPEADAEGALPVIQQVVSSFRVSERA